MPSLSRTPPVDSRWASSLPRESSDLASQGRCTRPARRSIAIWIAPSSLWRQQGQRWKPHSAWRFLPGEFPSPSTCWRRLRQWEEEGVWLNAWRTLLGALDEEGLLKWEETFLDGSFAPAKKRGVAVGKTKRGKGTKWMVLVDGQGLPLGVRLESASPSEVTLAEATLDEVRVPRRKGRPRQKPERVIADRG